MRAAVGDRIVVPGHHVGDPVQEGEIVGVEGKEGGPPYHVRWLADGHEGLYYPGPDATVEHRPEAAAN